jgi:hypothetical protein
MSKSVDYCITFETLTYHVELIGFLSYLLPLAWAQPY